MDIPERSTAAIDLTFYDEDGELIDTAAISGMVLQVFGRDPNTPILTITQTPSSNPERYVLDLTGTDIDDVGSSIFVEFKLTYNSTTMGNGAVLRGGPYKATLRNSRISS